MFPFAAPAIIRSSSGVPSVGNFVWNPADMSAEYISLSNGNKTAFTGTTSSGNRGNVRTTTAISQNIANVKCENNAFNLVFGLSILSASIATGAMFTRPGTYLVLDSGYLYKNGSQMPDGPQMPSFNTGDFIGVSFDEANIKFYKNNLLVFSTARTAGETGPLYPTFCGLGSQVTLTP